MYKEILAFVFIFQVFSLMAQADFYTIISYLASDSLEGRAPTTKGDILTQNYLTNFFLTEKLTVTTQKFSFPNENKIDTAANILAYVDNQKDSTILISAHYDHLGWGNKKSREISKKHQIHNGADDNASGVAMMLMLAHYVISDSNKIKSAYNYLFVAYSAHELGLFGSKYFSESADCQRLKIKTAFNFDMVGRLNKTNPMLKIGGTISDTTYNHFIHQYENTNLHFRLADEQLLQSDAMFLYNKAISSFSFTTGVHDDYHKAGDDSNKINYEGLATIFTFLKDFLKQINK